MFFRFSMVVAGWLVRWYWCSCFDLRMGMWLFWLVPIWVWVCGCSDLGMGMGMWLFWFVLIWVWVCGCFQFRCGDVVVSMVCGEWWIGGWWLGLWFWWCLLIRVVVVWWLLVISMVGLIWVWLVGGGGARFRWERERQKGREMRDGRGER